MAYTVPSGAISPSATVSAATLARRSKDIAEPILKKSPIYAMAQQKGRVTYNNGGEGITWPIRYRRRSIQAAGNPFSLSFPEVNRLKDASLPYRGYQLGEGVSKMTRLATKNDPNSYINALDKALAWGMDDFATDLSQKFYIDGAAGAANEMCGLETMFQASAVAANARVGTPAGTYAGLSMVLGNYGGSWTAETSEAWPTGWGSDQYRFWSPFELDTTNTKWNNATKTWANNWQEQVTWLLAMMGSLNDMPFDAVIITPQMMADAKLNVINNQTFELTQNKDTIEAGVKAFSVEGTEFMQDGRIAKVVSASVGYAVTWDKMEIACMGSEMIESDTDLDLTTKIKEIGLDSLLQMKFESPAYFGKFVAIS